MLSSNRSYKTSIFQVWQKDRMESSLRDLEKTLCKKELSEVPECKKQ